MNDTWYFLNAKKHLEFIQKASLENNPNVILDFSDVQNDGKIFIKKYILRFKNVFKQFVFLFIYFVLFYFILFVRLRKEKKCMKREMKFGIIYDMLKKFVKLAIIY